MGVAAIVVLALAGIAPAPGADNEPFFDSGRLTPAEEPDATDAGAFFDPARTSPSEEGAVPTMPVVEELPPAPPMPPIEELPSRDVDASSPGREVGASAPTIPPVEELPSRDGGARRFSVRQPDPARKPAGSDGGSFFDPAKLDDGGTGGGAIQIRGFVSANFFVAMRTNLRERDEAGRFERLSPTPFFDVNSATLYVGAPIYSDVVYARMGLEFLSIPTVLVNSSAQADIIPQANRQLFFESAAIEVNPLAWAKKAPEWARYGFKLTGGVFIVPFGIEDEEHAAPANWFITRPRSMTSNRVYPGTWTDVGAMLKWKPRFDRNKPIRPIEIDVGVVNGDPCSQTRFVDTLFRPGINILCSRPRRVGEVEGAAAFDPNEGPRIDSGFFGIASDNNHNKSVVGRVQAFVLPALNVGASVVYGKHPDATRAPEIGKTTADLGQAATYRVGGHFDLDLDAIVSSKYPLPALRGEVVYGVDFAVDRVATGDRAVLGGYAQIAQPLFRRKKSRLPGLILQYRFDHADPDLKVPGTVRSATLRSDFSDQFFADETLQSHTIGLRFPALPRFSIKTEYSFVLEDGGAANALYNDLWGIQMVADF